MAVPEEGMAGTSISQPTSYLDPASPASFPDSLLPICPFHLSPEPERSLRKGKYFSLSSLSSFFFFF
jgi:hypothetical protein